MVFENYGEVNIFNTESKGCSNCTMNLLDEECMSKLSAKCIASIALRLVQDEHVGIYMIRIKDSIVKCDGTMSIEILKVNPIVNVFKTNVLTYKILLINWIKEHENVTDSIANKYILNSIDILKNINHVDSLHGVAYGLLYQLQNNL